MAVSLSAAEVLQFHERGYLPPFELMSTSVTACSEFVLRVGSVYELMHQQSLGLQCSRSVMHYLIAKVTRFRGAGTDSMAKRRAELERIFDEEANEGHNAHQHEAAVWELASHGAIVGRMASLLGGDLSIWRTNFFVKEGVDSGSPLQREIPFHQ